jgi:PadR family transcriptional regulator PadR
MTSTQFALAALAGVIGAIIARLAYRAIWWTAARKRAPDDSLPVRLTRVNRRRLLVLLTDAANIGGGDIWRFAGGSAGDAYTFLGKLEDAGLVTSGWEAPEPLDRPRRRFYHLTPEGRAAAMRALGLKEGVRS